MQYFPIQGHPFWERALLPTRAGSGGSHCGPASWRSDPTPAEKWVDTRTTGSRESLGQKKEGMTGAWSLIGEVCDEPLEMRNNSLRGLKSGLSLGWITTEGVFFGWRQRLDNASQNALCQELPPLEGGATRLEETQTSAVKGCKDAHPPGFLKNAWAVESPPTVSIFFKKKACLLPQSSKCLLLFSPLQFLLYLYLKMGPGCIFKTLNLFCWFLCLLFSHPPQRPSGNQNPMFYGLFFFKKKEFHVLVRFGVFTNKIVPTYLIGCRSLWSYYQFQT